MKSCARIFSLMLCLSALTAVVAAQVSPVKPKTTKKAGAPNASAEADPLAEMKRTTAIVLVTSLADEARSFRNETLRARVQARAADALWETERDRARALFRRAWDAAEAADAENDRRIEEEKRRQERERGSFSVQLPPSLRNEVLRLAARRERALGEEFLAKMEESKKREESNSVTSSTPADSQAANASPRRPDPNNDDSPIVAKRLRLASQLLEDGNIDSAIQFADPALQVFSRSAMEFLTRLRTKNAAAADERYAVILARAALDPASDANVVSILGSYIFTPTLYVTFSPTGGSSSNSWGGTPFETPPDVAPQLRAAFFNVAASILLRTLPPPDQDRTSSGRTGHYMVITRLLPLFEQYAPDKADALRTQLAALVPDVPESARRPGNNAFVRGIKPEDPNRDRLQETLTRLERAKTAEQRDAVYIDAVFDAMRQKDPRVSEFMDKIEDLDVRKQLRAYIAYAVTRRAIEDKDATEALRLARTSELTSTQRTWALTEVAKLYAKNDSGRALEILEEATAEAKRIDAASSERASALVAIATQFSTLDRGRAWEAMGEVVKASNAADGFTGEDGRISTQFRAKTMGMSSNYGVESFDLTGIFTTLAREDLNRAVELAKSFNGESPRAVATLAIVRSVLDKKTKQ